jgi:GNAT superfamily N-acetyltransferase
MTAQATLPLVNSEQLGTPWLSLGAFKAQLAAWVETCVDYHQESHRDRCGPALSIVTDLGSGSIRKLADNDLQSYLHHLLRLSRQCRRSRFGNEVNDNFLRDYVARVDLTNTVVLGYFAEGAMRGAAELRSLRNVWYDEAEAAFSVEEANRSQGLGTALMASALHVALKHGVKQVHLICDRHNRSMQRIAEKVGADMRYEDSDCMGQISVAKHVETLEHEKLRVAA